jgi:acetyl-CoA carboxylase biotin carboxyl carrier protein
MPEAKVDHELVRELVRLLDETGLTEIEVERDGVRVRIARHVHSTHVVAGAAVPTPVPMSAPVAREGVVDLMHPGMVTSPMVGTVYRSPEPGARPFVDIGSQVKAGDTILIIEAMKTLNQIPAPRAGTVVQILIEDGHPVEFGEPLMIIG